MQVDKGRMFIGRFKAGSDLLLSLTDFCRKENIVLGVFSIIGAVTSIKLGYYNQDVKKYAECLSLDKKLEITSCNGNISLQDLEILVHAHISLADHQGQAYGGHLMPESKILAAEYYIQELLGGKLERCYDSETGLNLWEH